MTIDLAGIDQRTTTTGQTPAQWNVVVIGAGVAGASAAIWCARAGLRTLLVEKQVFPRDKVCGCCLNGRAMALLDRLGMRERLAALHPTPLSRMHVHFGGRSVSLPVNRSMSLSRRSLDQELVRAAVDAGCVFLDQTTAVVLPSAAAGLDADLARSVELRTHREGAAPAEPPVPDSAHLVSSSAEATPSPQNRTSEFSCHTVLADVVLVCDGLNHASLKQFPEIQSKVASHSRIGLGAIVPWTAADTWYVPGEVQMGVSRVGYVGTVGIEQGQLDLAAAVDAEFLQQHRTPKDALLKLFFLAGMPAPAGLPDATVRGTPLLTRKTSRVSLPRVFLLGDATGYVEPFTGEGMAWALSAASTVLPFVKQAVCEGWSADLAPKWQQECHRNVGRSQRVCRILAAGLRRPWLLSPLMTAARCLPWITHAVMHGIDRPLKTIETTETRPC